MVVPLIVPPINDVAHDVAKHPIGEQVTVLPKIVGALAFPPVDIVRDPVTNTLPVNVCVFAIVFPNILDPEL